jgi:CRISPR-associated protein (TIGR02710 family)
MAPSYTLLICTVGGSPEPIVASLKHWHPDRVLFVPTRQTRDQIRTQVLPLAEREGLRLNPGCFDILELPDGQDFGQCLHRLRELTPEVQRWLARGDAFGIVVDYTGGTKSMSAALALQAHPWGCRFSYVGGAERTKDGVGIVVSGKEQIVHTQNPWEALGYQAVEDAITLFDRGAYAAASQLLQGTLYRVQDAARKRELNALKTLAEAYDAWDRFEHKDAARLLGELSKYENDLRALLGLQRSDRLCEQGQRHRRYLDTLLGPKGPTWERVADLLANALRRSQEGRFDDAVARLYRTLEAIAQTRLHEAHGIGDTKKVPLERVPEPLRSQWSERSRQGTVFLGVQDAYLLLAALNDARGRRFQELGLPDPEGTSGSPLTSRNQSILAHGFEAVGDKVFRQLYEAALQLAQVREADLPVFPKLNEPTQG